MDLEYDTSLQLLEKVLRKIILWQAYSNFLGQPLKGNAKFWIKTLKRG